jgi:hypothetical protein
MRIFTFGISSEERAATGAYYSAANVQVSDRIHRERLEAERQRAGSAAASFVSSHPRGDRGPALPVAAGLAVAGGLAVMLAIAGKRSRRREAWPA